MSTLVDRDLAVLWHPCSQMRDYRDFPPIEVVGAAGCRLHLADGRRIYDAISSWWCKGLGHGHPRLTAALIEQAGAFEHVILANTTYAGVVRLCERLLALANDVPGLSASGAGDPHFGKVFLADNGSTGVEVALKLALHAQRHRGQAKRIRFAALAGGYHGETAGALSVGDCGLYKDDYAPMLFPCLMLGPLPLRSGPDDERWMDASREWPVIAALLQEAADTLAAVIVEPVLQGAGGMRLHSPDLLRRLRDWCDAHGVLLIADEIAAGMGRCGTMLASHLAGVLPDLAVLGKGLTGGYLPLSAVLVTDSIYGLFDADYLERRAFLHSNTFTGNALAVAVANAVLDVFAEDRILDRVVDRSVLMRDIAMDAVSARTHLRDMRGVGMIVAFDLCTPTGECLGPARRSGFRVQREALRRGALFRPLGDTLYLCPPLTTEEDDLRAMMRILMESIDAVIAGD